MTSRRWLLWLGTTGAGACLALGAGAGIASADTDSSEGTDTASRSSDQESAAATQEPATGAAEESTTADDPATVPAALRSTAAPTDTDTDTLDTDEDLALQDEVGAEIQEQTEAEPEAEVEDEVEDDAGAETEADADADAEATETQTETETELSALTVPADEPSDEGESLAAAASVDSVTGVQTGRAKLTIPVGDDDFTTRADWYFPTQADGSIAATGVIWLQHGFLGSKSSYAALAKTLSQQTNSIVVAANLPSFPSLRCGGCWINGTSLQQGVASMFIGGEDSLNLSATAAGFAGTLPTSFVLSGHSAGGGFATATGGWYAADPASGGNLRGVVMFDGFTFAGVVPGALQRLDDPYIPVYQIAAPPQPFNSNGATTAELVAARPGQFVGVTLANGSHVDSLLGSNPLIDFFAQLVTRFSPPGNTQAVYTLATGWINDLYLGLGPAHGTGIYGAPDEYIVMGDTAAVALAPPPVVDLDRYLGTWYEVGSVKQFFSIGLVNTTAQYSLNPAGSIRVENSGNYFVNNGPESSIVGVALPVDGSDNKLTVRFFGPASDNPPGNYWIVDLDPDYQWAIVSDATGLSGFLLTRTRTVSDDFYQQLLDRASVKGVKGRITPTRQPAADAMSV